jgi:DNA repair exonuclease SbcCD ATPase subunit
MADRMAARARKQRAEAEALLSQNRKLGEVMAGTPVLIGHHSEGRHRRDLARMDARMGKAVALMNSADDNERRAAAAESSRAIDSDDPEAVTKLKEKLARLENFKAEAKKVNAAIRKAQKRAAKGEDMLAATAAELASAGLRYRPETIALLVKPDFAGRVGVPDYELTNKGAEIRRVKARIAELEASTTKAQPADETIGTVVISESLNRVQMRFGNVPPDATRIDLKGVGFRWAPSEGAWQRKASPQAWYAAREIARNLAGEEK